MKFLHINQPDDQDELNELNKYLLKDNTHMFILFYMEGCGPCNAVRPEWKKIQHTLNVKNNDVVVVDIDQTLTDKIHNLKDIPSAFPCIRYISNKGEISENYEGSRDIDSINKWMLSNINKHKQHGGKKHKKLHSNKHEKMRRKTHKKLHSKKHKKMHNKTHKKLHSK